MKGKIAPIPPGTAHEMAQCALQIYELQTVAKAARRSVLEQARVPDDMMNNVLTLVNKALLPK